jgi:hypothetical protein
LSNNVRKRGNLYHNVSDPASVGKHSRLSENDADDQLVDNQHISKVFLILVL